MEERCLIFGAGSIGKSVAGYVFSKLGFTLQFVDINHEIIDDINARGSYKIYSSIHDAKCEIIRGAAAVSLADRDEVCTLISNTDYICTAIGAKGIDAIIPVLAQGMKARKNAGNHNPLYILLCENYSQIYEYITEKISGYLSKNEMESIFLVETSIERMTKPMVNNGNEFDVLAEEFFPIIIGKSRVKQDNPYFCKSNLFMPVEDVRAYYYRKLYTNNLGHAVLGYFGYAKNYKSILEAMNDTEIHPILLGALYEAGQMMTEKYRFPKDEMQSHLDRLLLRYGNAGLDDELERLIRDPKRKLSRQERLVGAAAACLECGIYPGNIIKTILKAIAYRNKEDIQSEEIGQILEEKGIGAVLESVCGLRREEPLYNEVLRISCNDINQQQMEVDGHGI